jgi:hypothetical protein
LVDAVGVFHGVPSGVDLVEPAWGAITGRCDYRLLVFPDMSGTLLTQLTLLRTVEIMTLIYRSN